MPITPIISSGRVLGGAGGGGAGLLYTDTLLPIADAVVGRTYARRTDYTLWTREDHVSAGSFTNGAFTFPGSLVWWGPLTTDVIATSNESAYINTVTGYIRYKASGSAVGTVQERPITSADFVNPSAIYLGEFDNANIPSNPQIDDIYFNTTNETWYVEDQGGWVPRTSPDVLFDGLIWYGNNSTVPATAHINSEDDIDNYLSILGSIPVGHTIIYYDGDSDNVYVVTSFTSAVAPWRNVTLSELMTVVGFGADDVWLGEHYSPGNIDTAAEVQSHLNEVYDSTKTYHYYNRAVDTIYTVGSFVATVVTPTYRHLDSNFSFGNPALVFADDAARDAHFVATPTDLTQYDNDPNLIIQVGTAYQHRFASTWTDVSILLRGAMGDPGTDGNTPIFRYSTDRITFSNTPSITLPTVAIQVSLDRGTTYRTIELPPGPKGNIGDPATADGVVETVNSDVSTESIVLGRTRGGDVTGNISDLIEHIGNGVVYIGTGVPLTSLLTAGRRSVYLRTNPFEIYYSVDGIAWTIFPISTSGSNTQLFIDAAAPQQSQSDVANNQLYIQSGDPANFFISGIGDTDWSPARLLHTPNNNGVLESPTGPNQLGEDNQGNLYGSHPIYSATILATGDLDEWTSANDSNYLGTHGSNPRSNTVGNYYYNTSNHTFRVRRAVPHGFGTLEWVGTSITSRIASNAIFVGEFDTQQEALESITSYNSSRRYFVYIRHGSLLAGIYEIENYVAGSPELTTWEWSKAGGEEARRISALEQRVFPLSVETLNDLTLGDNDTSRQQFQTDSLHTLLSNNPRARADFEYTADFSTNDATDTGTIIFTLQHGTTSIASATLTLNTDTTVELAAEVSDMDVQDGIFMSISVDTSESATIVVVEDQRLQTITEFQQTTDQMELPDGVKGNVIPDSAMTLTDALSILNMLSLSGTGTLEREYAVTNSTDDLDWHTARTANDRYIRLRTAGQTWTTGIPLFPPPLATYNQAEDSENTDEVSWTTERLAHFISRYDNLEVPIGVNSVIRSAIFDQHDDTVLVDGILSQKVILYAPTSAEERSLGIQPDNSDIELSYLRQLEIGTAIILKDLDTSQFLIYRITGTPVDVPDGTAYISGASIRIPVRRLGSTGRLGSTINLRVGFSYIPEATLADAQATPLSPDIMHWSSSLIGEIAMRFAGGVTPNRGLWLDTETYSIGQYVRDATGLWYMSLVDSNLNNDPTTDVGTNWIQFGFNTDPNRGTWSASETYAVGEYAQGSNSGWYLSLTDSNIGNDPTTDTTNWIRFDVTPVTVMSPNRGTWTSPDTYETGQYVQGSNSGWYISLSDSNTNNDPTTDTTNWRQFDINTGTLYRGNYNQNTTYAQAQIVTASGDFYISQLSNNIGNTPELDNGSNWKQIDIDTNTDPNRGTWSGTATYGTGEYTQASNGGWYISLTASNTNNDPTTDTTNWVRFDGTPTTFVTPNRGTWLSSQTYETGQYIQGSNNGWYVSMIDSNTANDPTTDMGVNWVRFALDTNTDSYKGVYNSLITYDIGDYITAAGTIYFSIVDSNLGISPTTDDGTNWVRFTADTNPFKGFYSSTVVYNRGDYVMDGLVDHFYFSVTDNNTGNLPVADMTGTNWVRVPALKSYNPEQHLPVTEIINFHIGSIQAYDNPTSLNIDPYGLTADVFDDTEGGLLYVKLTYTYQRTDPDETTLVFRVGDKIQTVVITDDNPHTEDFICYVKDSAGLTTTLENQGDSNVTLSDVSAELIMITSKVIDARETGLPAPAVELVDFLAETNQGLYRMAVINNPDTDSQGTWNEYTDSNFEGVRHTDPTYDRLHYYYDNIQNRWREAAANAVGQPRWITVDYRRVLIAANDARFLGSFDSTAEAGNHIFSFNSGLTYYANVGNTVRQLDNSTFVAHMNTSIDYDWFHVGSTPSEVLLWRPGVFTAAGRRVLYNSSGRYIWIYCIRDDDGNGSVPTENNNFTPIYSGGIAEEGTTNVSDSEFTISLPSGQISDQQWGLTLGNSAFWDFNPDTGVATFLGEVGRLVIDFGSVTVPLTLRNTGSEDTTDVLGLFLRKNSEPLIEMVTARNVLIGVGDQSIDLRGRGEVSLSFVEDDQITFSDENEYTGSLLVLRDSSLTSGFSATGSFDALTPGTGAYISFRDGKIVTIESDGTVREGVLQTWEPLGLLKQYIDDASVPDHEDITQILANHLWDRSHNTGYTTVATNLAFFDAFESWTGDEDVDLCEARYLSAEGTLLASSVVDNILSSGRLGKLDIESLTQKIADVRFLNGNYEGAIGVMLHQYYTQGVGSVTSGHLDFAAGQIEYHGFIAEAEAGENTVTWSARAPNGKPLVDYRTNATTEFYTSDIASNRTMFITEAIFSDARDGSMIGVGDSNRFPGARFRPTLPDNIFINTADEDYRRDVNLNGYHIFGYANYGASQGHSVDIFLDDTIDEIGVTSGRGWIGGHTIEVANLSLGSIIVIEDIPNTPGMNTATYYGSSYGDLLQSQLRNLRSFVPVVEIIQLIDQAVLVGSSLEKTLNDDGTITLNVDSDFLNDSVLVGTRLVKTDNGDGTITLNVNPDYIFNAVQVRPRLNKTDNGDGSITLDINDNFINDNVEAGRRLAKSNDGSGVVTIGVNDETDNDINQLIQQSAYHPENDLSYRGRIFSRDLWADGLPRSIAGALFWAGAIEIVSHEGMLLNSNSFAGYSSNSDPRIVDFARNAGNYYVTANDRTLTLFDVTTRTMFGTGDTFSEEVISMTIGETTDSELLVLTKNDNLTMAITNIEISNTESDATYNESTVRSLSLPLINPILVNNGYVALSELQSDDDTGVNAISRHGDYLYVLLRDVTYRNSAGLDLTATVIVRLEISGSGNTISYSSDNDFAVRSNRIPDARLLMAFQRGFWIGDNLALYEYEFGGISYDQVDGFPTIPTGTAGESLVVNPQETGFALRDDRIATAVYRGRGQVGHLSGVQNIIPEHLTVKILRFDTDPASHRHGGDTIVNLLSSPFPQFVIDNLDDYTGRGIESHEVFQLSAGTYDITLNLAARSYVNKQILTLNEVFAGGDVPVDWAISGQGIEPDDTNDFSTRLNMSLKEFEVTGTEYFYFLWNMKYNDLMTSTATVYYVVFERKSQ